MACFLKTSDTLKIKIIFLNKYCFNLLYDIIILNYFTKINKSDIIIYNYHFTKHII